MDTRLGSISSGLHAGRVENGTDENSSIVQALQRNRRNAGGKLPDSI